MNMAEDKDSISLSMRTRFFVKGRQFEASDAQGKYWFSNYQTVIDLEK